MIQLAPFHDSATARVDSPVAPVYDADQQRLQAVVERDWHAAQMEDRFRFPPTSLGGMALVGWRNFRDEMAAERADTKVGQLTPNLEAKLAGFRDGLSRWDEQQRHEGEALLRHHGIPSTILEAYTEQMRPDTHPEVNLMAWMSHQPTETEPYGATNEQLTLAARWGASLAKEIAGDPAYQERLNNVLRRYDEGKRAAVQVHHRLSEGWLDKKPAVSRFIIGDIFGDDALGYESDGVRYAASAHYDYSNHEIHVWPYAYGHGIVASDHNIVHEATHAMGRFATLWKNEAFTERYASIIDGVDPQNRTDLVDAMQHVYDGANQSLDDAQTSACFIGPDPYENEARLHSVIQQAYNGLDVMGALDTLVAQLIDYTDEDGRKLSQADVSAKLSWACNVIGDINWYRANDTVDAVETELAALKDLSDGHKLNEIVATTVTSLFESNANSPTRTSN